MEIQRAAPASYRAMIALGQSVELEPLLGELVKARASIVNGCAYCLDMHAKDARKLGETEERLLALATWRDSPLFTDRERAALALTDSITLLATSHVPREVYDEAAAHFPEHELAALIWAIAVINSWNRIAVSTRMLPGVYQPSE